MTKNRVLQGGIALLLALGLLPSAAAFAAVNKPPRIMKAEMKDANGNGIADRVVLTYSEKINHKLDVSRFPFQVQGHKILKVNGARRSLRLTIVLKENSAAPAKPASIKYVPTRLQPVLDLRKKQAMKQLLTKNIIGLNVTPPPPGEFTVTVFKAGDGLGSVKSNDSKIDCGTTCSATYPTGSVVTLTAAPDAASKAEWAGWSDTACGMASSCQITVDGDEPVTATFKKPGSRTLTVTKSGDGNVTSTSSPTQTSQINCGATCSASYPAGTIVTLTAAPDTSKSATFTGWSGDATCGTNVSCNVTMDAAKTVTATFSGATPSTLQVVLGGGTGTGTVTSSDGKLSCAPTCSADFAKDTVVTLTATPSSTSDFKGWSGDATCGLALTCDVTMSASKNVGAAFDLKPASTTTYALSVTIASVNGGNGTVTCMVGVTVVSCNGSFAAGTKVTLTALPDLLTLPPSTFTGWSGACSGILLTCDVTMDAAKSVTATFTK